MKAMSLRAKTILGVAAIEAVILAILILGGLSWLKSSNEEQLVRYGEMLANTFAASNADAVVATDLASLQSFARSVVGQGEVVSMRVQDRDGRELVRLPQQAAEAEPDPTPLAADDGIYHVQAPIELAGEVWGEVALGIDVRRQQTLMQDARRKATQLALLGMVLVALFSFLLGGYLLRQLKILSDAARTIAQSGPGLQLAVARHDELAELTRAFNEMSSRLASSHREFEQSIDAQRTLALEVEQQQGLMGAMIDAALDAIITIDAEGRIREFNASAESIFGLKREAILGEDMAELIIPPQFREAHRGGMARFLKTGEAPVLGQRLELVAQHAAGHQFDCELAIKKVEVGGETLFTAFMRDISDRKRAEQELLLAAHAFDTNEAIFITDAEANIVRVNQAFSRITGYPREEVLGQNPRLMASGEHDQAFYQQMWQALAEQGRWSGEVINRKKGGELFPEWLNISAVRDEAGNTSHYVAHFIDLTEQKAVEASLRQARVEAEAASEAKSRFLANMSHEIRTPLNAIISMNQLVLETELEARQRRFLDAANRAGFTLLALVNNVLDFSKIEAGKIELKPDWFPVAPVLEGIVELYSQTAKEKGLILTCQPLTEPQLELYGDPLRFRQILFNLVSNAVKFTEQGQIDIRLEPLGERLWQLSVKDEGIGIDAAQQAQLFEEFYQVDSSTTRHHSGSGLGLAITHQLVERMEGQIELDSALGQGSEFRVQLPLRSRIGGEEAPQPDLLDDGTRPLRILVVEDSATNREVVAEVLKQDVSELAMAVNGAEAVSMAAQRPFDLVLMDMAMPVMDGLEATRRIRAQSGPNQKVPIIAMTANAFAEDRDACMEAGMDAFLPKPISIKRLRQMVRLWGKQGRGETPPAPMVSSQDGGASLPWLDASVLDKLAADLPPQSLDSLVTMMLKEARERVGYLQQAHQAGDYERVKLEAHTLKSSLATFGALRLQALAKEIDGHCKAQQFDPLPPLVAQLSDGLAQTQTAIEEYRSQDAS
ncbi:PAS domain S-box protein [Ferrimonas marina]|uniref:Sensory/regulatory protein RpfC n=1 Tax=Ferrimonas marina TaxID=299255 RepID=A0A1M5RSM2_9GAMM|nr:PAS domain S-box protein [Ferrimonas marina]SHH29284.1 PAS domain S-box-containing protein [Ferrimonas marina]